MSPNDPNVEPARPDDPAAEPEQLREEIADTREELGETVAALAQKADVKAQASAKVEEKKERPWIPIAGGAAALALLLVGILRRRAS